ncbi:MAG: hypothetical protein RIT27_2062 [Pseudomonadota bacterium]|jgi:inorganic triphosphatase YgiF
MSTEIELKLRIAPHDTDHFKKHPLLKKVSPQIMYLKGTYFDTPELYLKQAKIAIRIREENGILIQAVKTAGQSSGGLHQRHEWECKVKENYPDLQHIPHEIRSVFSSSHLKAVFTTEFERTSWLIHDEEESVVEVCLDEGDIYCGELSQPICEVELELKRGEITALYQIASALQTTVHLMPENQSKAARGYQLFSALQIN